MIIIDLGPLSAALEDFGIKAEAFADAAVRRVASKLAERWSESIKVVPGIRPDERSEYMSSIGFEMVGPASAVVSTSFKNAHQIEEGRPAYDMKAILQTSVRTKISKDGKKYLTIPFRHGNPRATVLPPMTKDIYKPAKRLSVSTVTGQTNRINGLTSEGLRSRWLAVANSRNGRGAGPGNSNFIVKQNTYEWGGRLPAGLSPKLQPHHVTDPTAGMVKMREGKSNKASGYLTMRTMSESSSGWIQKATPGLFILRNVAAFTQADAPDIVRELLYEMR